MRPNDNRWTPSRLWRLYELRIILKLEVPIIAERTGRSATSIHNILNILNWTGARRNISKVEALADIEQHKLFTATLRLKYKDKAKLKAQTTVRQQVAEAKAEPARPYKPGKLEWK